MTAMQRAIEDIKQAEHRLSLTERKLREAEEGLVELIKADIKAVASIYPTAFNLYDEPMDRLARRICKTVERYRE